MHIQYVGAAVGEDLVAEGWIVRRGQRVVFCEAEVHGGTTGEMIAKSMLTYNVQLVGQMTTLSEAASKELLRAAGVPLADERRGHDARRRPAPRPRRSASRWSPS